MYNAVVGLLVVLNSGVSSSLPSNAVPAIMHDFGLSENGQKVLPTSIFLIGYCIGPLVWSPLSETIGRRPVLFWTFTVFFLGTLGCALAPNWSSLLIFRVICGTMAAAPQTVVGGVYADLFSDLRSRGRAMALYMSVCTRGLVLFGIHSNQSPGFKFRSHYWADYLRMLGPVWLAMDVSHRLDFQRHHLVGSSLLLW